MWAVSFRHRLVPLTPRMRASVLCLVLAGCTGDILLPGPAGQGAGNEGGGPGGPGGSGGGGDALPVPVFACAEAAEPSPSTVQRLTHAEYLATLEDLLGRAFTPAQVSAALASGAVAPAVAALPTDGTGGKDLVYDSQDQRISTLLIGPQVDIATGLAEWVASDNARLTAFTNAFGNCSTPTQAACIDAVVSGFGARALRAPLTPEDVTFYRAAYDATTYGGYRGLIASYLLAPGFLFRTEMRGDDVAAQLTRLTPHELAARLAYTVTGSMPDEALLTAAANGFTGDALDVQLERLLQTPRARAHLEGFFRQWLRPERVHSFNPSAVPSLAVVEPMGPAQAMPLDTDLPQLRTDAIEEMVALLDHYAFDAPNGSMRDVLTSDVSFARTPALAQVYGVGQWQGDAQQLVHFPAGQRGGLFTRAGYLFSGYPDSNPIIRGARLRVEYLCDQLQPPADISTPTGYVAPAIPTVRNLTTAKTEIAGTSCRACHAVSINPLGFPFEKYDAFGRFRHSEPLRDAMGMPAGWQPIDSTTAPNMDRNGSAATVTDALELSQQLAGNERFHACFARHAFRALTGRQEKVDTGAQTFDGCVLQSMQKASQTGSIRDVLRGMVHSPHFSLHKLPAEI